MAETLGLYLSIPFCKAKCSFCNFSSGVFAAARLDGYVGHVCAELRAARDFASSVACDLPQTVDTIYLGGGTPSLLEPAHIRHLFSAIGGMFEVEHSAEVTVECAPGQLSDASLAAFQRAGVNRLSFGVQSFVDAETAAVGRLHTAAEARAELRRLERAGVERMAVDLICGLPGQTEDSWRHSLDTAIETGIGHVSVYMLEVDEGSRLGREKLLGGVRYGASLLPEDDRVADWYSEACEHLTVAGLAQYEISNFAREGQQSRHNRKYWQRAPYLGVGLDAHSMLRQNLGGVRFSNPDEMDLYPGSRTIDIVSREAAFEEELFLGLRLLEGVSLPLLRRQFGSLVDAIDLAELVDAGLVTQGERLCLTAQGRMVSNEVFERLLLEHTQQEPA